MSRRMQATIAALFAALLLVSPSPPGLLAQEAGAPEPSDGEAPVEEEDAEPTLETLRPPPRAIDPAEVPPGSGRLTLTPGQSYRAGALHRFVFGDLNRDLWDIPFEVEVLDLSREGGGLTPTELSGGQQTVGMRFEGANGRLYQFRSIVKTPARALPKALRISPFDDVVQDQMAAQFPLGAMVVAELLEAQGILVAKPRPVVMPDDPRLGEYRQKFAGLMGWIEERPDELEGDRPGFAGSSKITGTEELYESLAEDPRNYVNAEEYLRARLIDMLVGDWDRHHDQWRWASFEEGDRTRWDPIPRDRDWALSRIDGVLPGWASEYLPQYEASWDRMPGVFNLHWNAQFLDRRLLAEVPRETYVRFATDLRATMTDGVLERAVGVLPAAYREAVGDELLAGLQAKREEIVPAADEFYEMIAEWADIQVSDAAEVATVTGLEDGAVRVEVRAPEAGDLLVYSRTFLPEETREIRLYMRGGDDEVHIQGEEIGRITLRLVGDEGDDRFLDETAGRSVHAYDDDGHNTFELGPLGWYDETESDAPEEMPDIDVIFQARDWGSSWVWLPAASYSPDVGPLLGARLSRYGYGFRRDPYNSQLTFALQLGAEPGTSKADVGWLKTLTDGGLRFGSELKWATEINTRFFGLGNETSADSTADFFRSQRSSVEVGVRLESARDQALRAHAGPVLRFAGDVDREDNIFGDLNPYGAGEFAQAGLAGAVELGDIENPGFPTTSGLVELTGRAFPALLDVEEAFGSARLVGRLVLAADDSAPLLPALHLRAEGRKVWGSLIPFDEYAALGGEASLPGYRERRFAGEESVSGSGLARLRLFTMHPFATIDVGVHGIGTVGRVWLDGEESDEWHTAFGGGIWLYPRFINRALTVSLVKGEDRLRFYLGLGFPF